MAEPDQTHFGANDRTNWRAGLPSELPSGLLATAVTDQLPIAHGTLSLNLGEPRSLVSIAFPAAEVPALTTALERSWSLELPPVGEWADADKAPIRLLRLQQDLCFVQLPEHTSAPVDAVRAVLDGVGWVTDQSDSWLAVTLTGADATAALERLCMLDLHATRFGNRAVARTVMEHFAVMLHRYRADASSGTEPDGFTLYSPRSSAPSFLHALDTAMRSVATTALI